MIRSLPLLLGLLVILTGCLSQPVPTQGHPTCSWTTTPPHNAAQICDRTFALLTAVTHAIETGDERTIRRDAAPAVAAHIILYERQLRPLHPRGLHVVPSFTLSVDKPGLFGAGFYVLGKTRQAPIKDQESVYVRVTSRSVHITHDQTQQYW